MASTYPADSNDALVTELTGNFLVQVQALCSSEAAAILVCDMQDVSLNKCSATVQCSNESNMRSYACNAQQTATALTDAFSKLGQAPTADQAASIQTLAGALPGATGSSTGQLVALYAKSRCNLRGFSQQDVVYPVIQLTDCSGDTITALNQMDSMTRCSVGALSELVPPDPIPINSLGGGVVPVWDNALSMTIMASIAAVVLCIGILAAVAIANPGPRK